MKFHSEMIEMAQHIPIKEWQNQKWFKQITQEIEFCIKNKTYKEILPDDYKMDENDSLVVLYKSKMTDKIDEDNPEIRLNQCCFEIHVDKDNKILQVYLPL